MKALTSFIVRPAGKRMKDGRFVVADIENAKNVSKKAVVTECPANYTGNIKPGTEVIIHHNIFREYYDANGNLKKSRAYLYGDIYTAIPEEIFAYKEEGRWYPHLDYCFVKPMYDQAHYTFSENGREIHMGYIALSNEILEGTVVAFTPESEYEVDIWGEVLYRMRERDIAIIYHGFTGIQQ